MEIVLYVESYEWAALNLYCSAYWFAWGMRYVVISSESATIIFTINYIYYH